MHHLPLAEQRSQNSLSVFSVTNAFTLKKKKLPLICTTKTGPLLWHLWCRRKKKKATGYIRHQMQRCHSMGRSSEEKEKSNSVSFCIVDIHSMLLKYKHVTVMTVGNSHLSSVYLCVFFERPFLCCSGMRKLSSCLSFFVWYSIFLLFQSLLQPRGKTVAFFSIASTILCRKCSTTLIISELNRRVLCVYTISLTRKWWVGAGMRRELTERQLPLA